MEYSGNLTAVGPVFFSPKNILHSSFRLGNVLYFYPVIQLEIVLNFLSFCCLRKRIQGSFYPVSLTVVPPFPLSESSVL